MVLTAYNLEQRKISLKPFIKTYGLKLLNQISQKKHGVGILEVNNQDLSNLKTSLKKKGFKEFIIANKRLPTIPEGRSLGSEFGEGRIAMRSVKERLVADLKAGKVNITPESLAKKYGVTVEEDRKSVV